MADSSPVFLDPSPDEWLTPERLWRLDQVLQQAAPFLAMAGLLAKALGYWIRLELAQEIAQDSSWPEAERLQELERLEREWRQHKDPSQLGLTDQQLKQKLLVAPGSLRWARRQWGHRLESLYLQNKQLLDRASCRLLRLNDKHLAHELYHQIRAGEASFEQLSLQHGQGPERLQGGLLPLQPLAKLPLGLGPLLQRLRPGQLTPPQRLGDGFALVQLECFEPAPFDAASEEQLLAMELQNWIQALVPLLQVHLTSTALSKPENS